MKNNPTFKSKKFICPHCDTLAQQNWFYSENLETVTNNIYTHFLLDYRKNIQSFEQTAITNFLQYAKKHFPKQINTLLPYNLSISNCQACDNFSLWVDKEIVYPKDISIDAPNNDLNDEIKELYHEAATIFNESPKGATAILRLALQKLLVQLGKNGKNINNDIKELVTEGLNPKMQKALDFLRVIGNNAVHPGQINLDDNKDIALHLFKVLNMIAEDMITKPKEMESLYEDIIPDDTKEHIEQRDGKT